MSGEPQQYAFARRLRTTVQIEGADDGFGGVGKNRFTAETTTFQFARAQPQVITQLETLGQCRQRRALHQACAQAGKLSFPGLRKALEQRLGSNEVENRVAEKFQAFVVAPPQATVGQCQNQQVLILETVAYSSFQSV